MKVPSFSQVAALFTEEVLEPVEVQLPIQLPELPRDDWVIRAATSAGSLLKKAVVRETVYHIHGETHSAFKVRWGVVSSVAGLGLTCWAGRRLYGIIQELKLSEGKEEKPAKIPSITLKADDFIAAPECMRNGSVFKVGSLSNVPEGQMAIGFEAADKINEDKTTVYYVVGGAVRINNWAVFPTHCIMAGKKMFLIKPAHEGDEPKVFKIDPQSVNNVCPDVSAVYIEEVEFTRLGVKKIRLGKPSFGDAVQITTMVDYKYSTGVITRAKERFGHVDYHGSTAPGFSGACYQVGSSVVGMHMHGGNVNGGIEFPYLLVLLRFLEQLLDKPSVVKAPVGVQTPEARAAAAEGSDWIPDSSDKLVISNIGMIDDKQYCAVRTTTGDYKLTTEERMKALAELRKKQKSGNFSWADEVELDDLENEGQPPASGSRVIPADSSATPRVIAGQADVWKEVKEQREKQAAATPVAPQAYPMAPVYYPPQMLPPYIPPPAFQQPMYQPMPPANYIPEAVMAETGFAYPGEFQRPGVMANPGSVNFPARKALKLPSAATQQKRTDRQKYVNLVSNLPTESLAWIHHLENTGRLRSLAMSQQIQAQQQSGSPSAPSSTQQQSSAQQ
nr:MAG: putative serine protease [Culex mosquito virus 6]